ncbi:MAG: hypothetical protein RIS52_2295 [Pseudomonadota bacterium]|jgi:hypothetical protein
MNRSRLILTFWLGLLGFGVTTPVLAQTAGQANVTVLSGATIIKQSDLVFGNLIAGPTAGSVTISTAGARTVTGGTLASGGVFNAAEFAGSGARNQQVIISFGAPTIVLTRAGGLQTMTVSSFTINPVVGSGLTQLGASGRHRINATTGLFTFSVGAKLAVGANQTGGNYSGTFTVTVNYQ